MKCWKHGSCANSQCKNCHNVPNTTNLLEYKCVHTKNDNGDDDNEEEEEKD